jgi:hypothetical protein
MLPDGIFSKNPYLGKFWKFFRWKMLVFLWPFGLFYGQMVYVLVIWYIFWLFGIFFHFGMLYREESGNPATHQSLLAVLVT